MYYNLLISLKPPLLGGFFIPKSKKSKSLLPSAFCLLPSAFCLLPSAFCLLPYKYKKSYYPRPNKWLYTIGIIFFSIKLYFKLSYVLI